MKTSVARILPPFQQRAVSRRGFVVVLVLLFLILITALVVSFFLSVSTELSASKGYANGSNAKELADSAVQAVIGQIRLATASTNSSGTPITWASQPGMIRTYKSGSPLGAYKLYSSNNMIVTGSPTLDFTDDFDSTWTSSSTLNSALYTDLNSPVNGIFPIIDPRAAGVVSSGYSLVAGFSYAGTVTGGATTITIPGLTQPASSSDASALLPMPVRWIYLLKDGTMTVPNSGSGTTATWTGTGSTVPSAANPIVGRIAFWTDDETCKLNVNTACGGTDWDSPRATSMMELAYSRYKPVTNEFNRFPGHPATTSLLPVFWSYAGLTSPNTNLVPLSNFPTNYNSISAISASPTDAAPVATTLATDVFENSLFNFTPRYGWGGSDLGTVATMGWGVTTPPILTPNLNRLYATIDEALFASPPASPVANSARSTTSFVSPSGTYNLAASDVEKLRFFLTANSRAPEMNPFNLPKISLWPQLQTAANRTTTDSLLAFCSTLNGNSYYFTRGNSLSATADWTTRNGNLFSYLVNLWGMPIPGFGGNLQTRYTLDGDNRIMTLIYDYLRSTVNIFDTWGATSNSGPFKSAFMAQTNWGYMGYGQVTPINIKAANGVTYKGLGRFPGIKQVAIMFIARAAHQPPLEVVPSGANVGRPLLFASDGVTSLLDSNYNLTSAGITAVLGGNAYALPNPMHPVVNNPTSPLRQVLSNGTSGNPVLAVDPTKLAANPNDTTAIYPVFNPVNCYPTIADANNPPSGTAGTTIQLSAGNAGTFTYSGTPYPYYTATSNAPSSPPYPPQTHAGLPYLTVQRTSGASAVGNMEGAYDVPNPRYQGPPNSFTTPPLPDATMGTGTLTPSLTQVQAIILIDPVCPEAGQPFFSPALQVQISGLDGFTVDGQSLGFPAGTATTPLQCNSQTNTQLYGGVGIEYMSMGKRSTTAGTNGSGLLAFVSNPVIIGTKSAAYPTDGGGTFNFTGGTITVNLYALGSLATSSNSISTSITSSPLVQTLNINFPSATFPTPLLPPMPPRLSSSTSLLSSTNPQSSSGVTLNAPATVTDLCPSSLLTFDTSSTNPLSASPNNGVGGALYAGGCSHTCIDNAGSNIFNSILPERTTNGEVDYHSKETADTVRSMEVLYGDPRVASSLLNVPTNFYVPHKYYFNTAMRSAHSFEWFKGFTGNFLTNSYTTMHLTSPYWGYDGDSGGEGVPTNSPTTAILYLQCPALANQAVQGSPFPPVCSSTEFDPTVFASVSGWSGLTPFLTVWNNGGDYDSGYGNDPDGPTINKPMEAPMEAFTNGYDVNPDYADSIGGGGITWAAAATYSPNRLVPSSVILGSLPIPVDANTPGGVPDPTQAWRTLLFCPNPTSYDTTKANNAAQTRTAVQQVTDAGSVPNGTTAPDHLFLDFFNMPVVAPYAISEPFSTAGKVNMNYQIAPFSYITRKTALLGVLRDSVITAVNDQWISTYKYGNVSKSTSSTSYWAFLTNTGNWAFRYPINATDTLLQFDQRFSNNDLFRSPSEICSLWLYPATQPTSSTPEAPNTPVTLNGSVTGAASGASVTFANGNIKNWWYSGVGTTAKSLTGENERERPYATIYPRLTTQSNTYTVHFRVQTLQKVPTTAANQWVDGTDTIQSEYRGSSLIERYIDSNDTTIPDVATTTTASSVPTLDNNFKYRVLATKRFAP